jgi:DNA-binding transcriptional MocR family regulator
LRHTLQLQQIRYCEAIERHFPEGTRKSRPAGGYFFWIKLPKGADALALHQQALKHGISLAPGPIFSAQRGFDDCIRLNYGHPWDERVAEAMSQLERLMASGRA